LEYVVLGIEDHQFMSKVLPELNAIQESGLIRAVDLVFVDKAPDGTVSVQEVSERSEEELAAYASLVDDLAGLLTAEDIEQLTGQIPASSSAVIVLFEHTWTLGLTDAVSKAGGVLLTGGMVTPETMKQVGAELAAKEENNA